MIHGGYVGYITYPGNAVHVRAHWRPRGGLSAATPAGECTARVPRTPPKLPLTARPAPTTGARVRWPLRPLRALQQLPWSPEAARGCGAATALWSATAQQTTRVGRGGAEHDARAAKRRLRPHETALAAVHAASCTRTHCCSRALRTSRKRPWQPAQTSAAKSMAAASKPSPGQFGRRGHRSPRRVRRFL